MNLISTATVIVATLLGSSMALPQARRLYSTRRVEGLSAAWIGVSVALNAWWLVYGFAQNVWVLIPVSALSVLLYLSIGAMFIHTTGWASLRQMFAAGVALGLLPLGFLAFGGWVVAGVVVGLCYGLQLLPAVVAVYRSDAVEGVATGTWLIALVESLLWLLYGLGVADVALIAGGSSGVVMASLILARLHVVRSNAIAARWIRTAQ
ncbi:MAG: hypothetical protein QNM02_16740 [Acidimicrobiia bacterium]|nr:hypothetical protein [Acidimicrobiia bacterium]